MRTILFGFLAASGSSFCVVCSAPSSSCRMRMCSRVVLVRVDLLLVLFVVLDVREDLCVVAMVFVPIISFNRYLYIIIVANI